MKKSKIFTLLISVIMCCVLLTGCYGGISDVTVNEDGSVDIIARSGMTKDYIDSSDEFDDVFVYDDITYYGYIEEQHYNSVNDFTEVWSSLLELSDVEGILKLEKVNNDFILTLDAENTSQFVKDGIYTFTNGENLSEMEESERKAAQRLIDTANYVLNFKFPKEVIQKSGSSDSVVINGSEVILDFKKMENITEDIVITTNIAENENVMILQTFKDVEYGSWYFNAVQSMAVGGLVTGIGNDLFNPNGTLTYAEFCQILSRAKGLETGSRNGYWGYEAIDSCIENGYIKSFGIIESKNYDKPITREAAVAAMFRAKAKDLYAENKVGNSIKESNIPDYKNIDEEYRRDVLNAYNSGISHGVDTKYTFNPKGVLTRAEVCQFFFNMNWTRAAK